MQMVLIFENVVKSVKTIFPFAVLIIIFHVLLVLLVYILQQVNQYHQPIIILNRTTKADPKM